MPENPLYPVVSDLVSLDKIPLELEGIKEAQQTQLDLDKENISWVFWINGGKMDVTKDYILIGKGNDGEVRTEITDAFSSKSRDFAEQGKTIQQSNFVKNIQSILKEQTTFGKFKDHGFALYKQGSTYDLGPELDFLYN